MALAGLDGMEIAPNKEMVVLLADEEGAQRDPQHEEASRLARAPEDAKPPPPKAAPPEASLQVLSGHAGGCVVGYPAGHPHRPGPETVPWAMPKAVVWAVSWAIP